MMATSDINLIEDYLQHGHTLNDIKNTCGPITVREISGKSDIEVFRAFVKNGFTIKRGSSVKMIISSLKELGVNLSPPKYLYTKIDIDDPRTVYHPCDMPVEERDYVQPYMGKSLKEMRNYFTKGMFVLYTNGHVFYMKDGTPHDTQTRRRIGNNRKVTMIQKVLENVAG